MASPDGNALANGATDNGNVRYHVTVVNGGPDVARSVALSDAVPPSSTFVRASIDHGTCSTPKVGRSGNVDCILDDLDVQQTAILTIVVHPTFASDTILRGQARLVNTAAVTHDALTVDPTPLDETQTLSLQMGYTLTFQVADLQLADVGISNGFSVSATVPGQVVHTITVKNFGPDPAGGVQVSVRWAAGISIAMAAIKQTQGGPCTEDFTTEHHVVACPVGTLAVGASATITIPTQVDPQAVLAGLLFVPWSQIYLPTEQHIAALDVMPPVPVASDASVTSGTIDMSDWNNSSQVVVSPPLSAIVNVFSGTDHAKCKNDPTSKFGALLGVDCDSPVNEVIGIAGTLASMAAGAAGGGVLGAIWYWGVYVVVQTVADTAIVTAL
jgi:uncharacterized repeat protein (TIGR01451 family)